MIKFLRLVAFLFAVCAFFAWPSLTAQTSTLYWVGGSGMWSEASHWANSSGGAGGAGVPDGQTNVVFDQSSFNAPGQTVEIDVTNAQCHDMTWTNGGVPLDPQLVGDPGNSIVINGSLTLMNEMQMPFKGDFVFTATDSNNTIDFNEFVVENDLVFQTSGQWTLQGRMRTRTVIDFQNGFIDADGYEILCSQFYSDYTFSRTLDISQAILQVSKTGNSWYVNTDNFNLIGPSSFVILHGPQPELINFGPDTLSFSGVLFADTSAQATLRFGRYFQVFFSCDGTMEEYNEMDSLYFTPGKTYEITNSVQQYVNGGWFSIGANCYPIKIQSTLPGVQATVSMGNARMQFEYNVIKDLTVTGSGNFNAGEFSADSGNTNGLTFDEANLVYSNLLGNDTLLCPGDSKTLTTRYYWGTADRLWQDNSTDQTYTVTSEGEYHVRLTYAPGCYLDDTIQVQYSDVDADLGADTILCEGDQITLETNPQPSWNVTWQDQSTNEQLEVTQPGTYHVTVEDAVGCEASDSVEVTEVAPPAAQLGGDTAICENEEITLQANADQSLNYEWQDGATSQTYQAGATGLYSVTVSDENGCQSTDEMQLTVNNNPDVELSKEITICENDEVVLDVNVSNATYEWNTGATEKRITIDAPGDYSVTVTNNNGCQDDDTVSVSVKPIPEFNIADSAICFEETGPVTFYGPDNVTYYEWSTGDTSQNITVSLPGNYWLEVGSSNNCSYRDEFEISNDCETEVFFPTAFTPNNDGKNDLLKTGTSNVRSARYKIFNRWGELIYVTDDEHCNWDGTKNGTPMPMGMYVITVKGVDNFGIPFKQRETVTIIR